ncbi:MAG: LysR family transcriptional regulator [Geminicoccaceae bacterium]
MADQSVTIEASISWDALRCFLVVARTGSFSAAAKVLGETPPTIGRRTRELEHLLSARLFDRVATGVRLTESGDRLLEEAEAMEAAAIAAARRVQGDDQALRGRVVVTAPSALGLSVVVPRLGEFRATYPDIELELLLGTQKLNLMARDADVALRVGATEQLDLIGRRIGTVSFGVYASRTYLAERGEPLKPSDLAGHCVIDTAGELWRLPQAVKLRAMAKGSRTVLRFNNVQAQSAAAVAGLGIAALPVYLGERQPELIRILDTSFICEEDVWMLTHSDLRHKARVRAVMDFLAEVARTTVLNLEA